MPTRRNMFSVLSGILNNNRGRDDIDPLGACSQQLERAREYADEARLNLSTEDLERNSTIVAAAALDES